jgi:DNA-binding NarL/FixJ family response regulator
MAAFRTVDSADDLPPLVVTSFNQLNFLVIDDSSVSVDLMEGVLRSVSVGEVRKAPSVFSAVGVLADPEIRTDCIICDHHMEGMTGLALLQRIRAGRNAIVPRDLRFIMVTGDTSADLVRAAVGLDVNGFISKPISVDAVLKAIHLAFGRPTRLKPAADYAKVMLPNAAPSR